MSFVEQYGPWALIAGASEGTGRAFALALARRGVPSILVARREEPLRTLARQILAETGVECLPASIDLAAEDAFERIRDAVGQREIGLFISNAGSDPNGAEFLDRDVERWRQLLDINTWTLVRCCHHFGGLMRARRRGGILVVGSGAAHGGGRCLAVYSGSKAFQMCFAESLWAELQPHRVHVLFMPLHVTDTPALRKLLAEKGKAPPARMAAPDKVAEVGLAHLAEGPVYNWAQHLGVRARWRRARVQFVSAMSAKLVFGADRRAG